MSNLDQEKHCNHLRYEFRPHSSVDSQSFSFFLQPTLPAPAGRTIERRFLDLLFDVLSSAHLFIQQQHPIQPVLGFAQVGLSLHFFFFILRLIRCTAAPCRQRKTTRRLIPAGRTDERSHIQLQPVTEEEHTTYKQTPARETSNKAAASPLVSSCLLL